MLSGKSLGIKEIPDQDVQYIYTGENDIARGGMADVYRGQYHSKGFGSVQVAVKKIRIHTYGEATKAILEKTQRVN
ncbi:hypothetical protein BDV93DRAFT_128269 [Ceratobasidium sp. AG-I]|nr:hypothetical protein BDV93DRAFT_128269 [Ceratobasidium sp. AG-I]